MFGQEKFSDVESFIEHFDNRPLLGDDTGESNKNDQLIDIYGVCTTLCIMILAQL